MALPRDEVFDFDLLRAFDFPLRPDAPRAEVFAFDLPRDFALPPDVARDVFDFALPRDEVFDFDLPPRPDDVFDFDLPAPLDAFDLDGPAPLDDDFDRARPEPLFLPPPSCLFTVAQARAAACACGRPRSS